MRKKQLINNVMYRILPASVFFIIPMIKNISMSQQVGTMESYFVFNFDGPMPIANDIVLLFFQLVPSIIILYLFSGIMLEDCSISYVYVFTRIGKKEPWLRKKATNILLQIMAVFALSFLFCLILGAVSGFYFESLNISLYVRLFIFQCGTLFLLSFIQNFVSLSQGRTKSFILILIFYVVCIIFGFILKNMNPILDIIISLLPPNSQMYSWHSDCPLPEGTELAFGEPISGFTTIRTLAVLCVCFFVFYAVAYQILKKRDLAEIMKGESS
jgi:hypothetical protein